MFYFTKFNCLIYKTVKNSAVGLAVKVLRKYILNVISPGYIMYTKE